jgi:hypothetical protein
MELPKRGYYDAEFKIGVGFDKKVTGYLVGLCPSSNPKVSRDLPASSTPKL